MPSASAANAEEADGPRAEEQGVVFKQNVAIMRNTLYKDVTLPSLDMTPRAELLSAIPKADLPQVEVPFSPLRGPKVDRTFRRPAGRS